MRAKRAHGRILSVETLTRGSALAEDAAAGATSITVVDAGDFEETDDDGPTPTAANPLGWLTTGSQVVAYLACDDDTGVIDLAEPLAAAGEEGDTVAVWSELYEEAIEYQQALVELDGRYDNPEPVEAEVHEGVGELPEGDRGKPGESCTLKRLSADEWEVVGVGGRGRQSQGTRWEQDDFYVLTAADITAGSATMLLSHRPKDEALTCVLAGVPQRPTEWSIDYDAQTLTISTAGWVSGDVLWVHYAYLKGVMTSVVPPVEYVIPTTGAVALGNSHPTGDSAPPYLIGDPPQWADDSDASYAELETFEHPDVTYYDTATASLQQTAVPTTVPAGYAMYARVRYQTLSTDMTTPQVSVYRSGATSDVNEPATHSATYAVAAAMSEAAWVDIPMASNEAGGIPTILTEIQPGSSQPLTLQVKAPGLRMYSFRTPRIRIFEAMLVLKEIP